MSEKNERGPIEKGMADKLVQAFSPSELDLRDDSAKHAGHAGARAGGETHFHVRIRSKSFEGKSRIERQRMIFHVLKEELAGPVHALGITALSEGEG
jgi:BolA protein